MTEVLVDDFLEHFGVKGMKWGVRKSRDGGSSGVKKVKKPIGNGDGKVSGDEAKAAAIAGAKIALKYGAPSAAVAVGAAVGLPAVAALGISVRALQDPGIQEALSVGARFVKDSTPDIPFSSIPKVKTPDIKLPSVKWPKDVFSEKVTTADTRDNVEKPMGRITLENGDTALVPFDQLDKFQPK